MTLLITTFSAVKIIYMDKISENIDWQIAYWYIQGLSTTEIGKKVGMHRSTIYRRLQKNSVQAIINSFRNEIMQNLFTGMLGLGREIISNYHIKVKNNKVSPSETNGFFKSFISNVSKRSTYCV